MQNKVLNGLVYGIDDVLIHGKSEAELLRDVQQVFERLRATNIALNPKQTTLGLPGGRIRRSPCLRDRHLVHPREAIEGP